MVVIRLLYSTYCCNITVLSSSYYKGLYFITQYNSGCCGWLLYVFSILLIAVTLPFSLVLTIKVST